ncbi:MAG: hypothetical protein KDD45_14345, partial [Bdellovibrionales bacterium]|nr:hypothetical protein [Bdellovibrionales bacterium]
LNSFRLKTIPTIDKIRFIIDLIFIDFICKRRFELKDKKQIFQNSAINKYGSEISIYENNFNSPFYPSKEFFLSLKKIQLPGKVTISSWIHFLPEKRVLTFLKPLIKEEFLYELDPESKRVNKSKILKYHQLNLKVIDGQPIQDSEKQQVLSEALSKNFQKVKDKIPSLKSFQDKIDFLMNQKIISKDFEINWQEVISNVCYGEHNLESILIKDWWIYLEPLLSVEEKNLFNQAVPDFWQAPGSNKKFKVNYSQGEASIEAKIQSFFGIKEHPYLGDHKYPLKIILLAPNNRPIQITKDLSGFWKSSYPDIRKELRGRYPKHSWPETP